MTDLTTARALADAADKAATCIVSGDPLDTGEFATLTADDSRDMAATIRALASEVERLRAAIGFYADPETYETQYEPKGCGCCTDIFEPINDDKGDIARAALQEKTNGME